jgi:hypothetical protein
MSIRTTWGLEKYRCTGLHLISRVTAGWPWQYYYYCCYYFAVLGLELRAYTLSHSTSPFFDGFF